MLADGSGPVPGAQLGAALVVISAWQVLCYVVWRGWPFTAIAGRGLRTTCAHVTVLGGGIGSYLVAHVVLSIDAIRIAAVAGCFIAAGLVFGMLLEDWLHDRLAAPAERAALLACTLAVTALLAVVLGTAAGACNSPASAPTTGSRTPPSTHVDLDHPARRDRRTLAVRRHATSG